MNAMNSIRFLPLAAAFILPACSGTKIVREDYELLLNDARKQMESTRSMPEKRPLAVLAVAVVDSKEPPKGSAFVTLDETTRVAQQALYKALATSSIAYDMKPREFYESVCRELNIPFPAGIVDVVNQARLVAELNRRGEKVDYVLLSRIDSTYDDANDLAAIKVAMSLAPTNSDETATATAEKSRQYRPYRNPIASALRLTWMPIQALLDVLAQPARSNP